MKAFYFFKVFLIVLVCSSFIQADMPGEEVKAKLSVSQTVYVCGGKYATKYHSRSNCSGLNNCKGGINKYDSQSNAKKSGYTACKICWK